MLYDFAKRLMDIVGAIVGFFVFAPIFLLAPILIFLNSPGPILYTPVRVGQFGRLFRMYKFRSMRMYARNGKAVHADELLKTNKQLLSEYKKNSYKLLDDPRVTLVGRFIRKYSLDEFPQFWNVLKGEMSLVGPRAYLPNELMEQQEVYPDTKPFVKTLLLTKPGLTGPWQVSGRSSINFDKRIKLDVAYVKRRSLVYDIVLVMKTFPALLSARGAV